MKGPVEVSDREIADAVAAVEDETLESFHEGSRTIRLLTSSAA